MDFAMHELPVTQSILDITLRHAKQANATRVTGIYLVIGQLATLVDDSIQFYWDMNAKDTIAEGATIHFKRIPAVLQCMICAEKYSPNGQELRCPNCGSVGVKVISGEEFSIEAIDVDEGATV
jgi:hydrogenase nickel incorporation protein HypA/HybF